MSEIIEGIAVIGSSEAIASAQAEANSSLRFQLAKVTDSLWVIYRDDPRNQSAFSDEVEHVAETLSTKFKKALVFRYDSRIGYRSSTIFFNGHPTESFDEKDEVYVLVDDNGTPLNDGQKYHVDELSDEGDYETIQNAIDLGLQALGMGTWDEVHKIVSGY